MCILCKLCVCVLHKTLARMKPESHLPVFTRPKIMDGRNWLIQNKKAEKYKMLALCWRMRAMIKVTNRIMMMMMMTITMIIVMTILMMMTDQC